MKSLKTLLLILVIATEVAAIQKENIEFRSGTATLAGTVFIPKGEGAFPALVFVHGSGPETRKNSWYSAKWLCNLGYVVLTYDKRGAGDSEGSKQDWNRFSFDTLSDDVLAAVSFLAKHKKVDASKIGLHATSQGGWVASLAASKSDLIQFMVIKSASICTVGEDRLFERAARLKREGFSEQDLAEAREIQLAEPNVEFSDEDTFAKLFRKYQSKPWFSRVYGGDDPQSSFLLNYRKWYASIASFDPVPYLEKSDIPIFWIFGDPALDQLGPVNQSVSQLNKLKKEGKPYELLQFSGEGHHVNERSYELALYKWLKEMHGVGVLKFKKH